MAKFPVVNSSVNGARWPALLDLDGPSTYARLDPSDMGGRMEGLAAQCLKAWRQALAVTLPEIPNPLDHVVICGMGGSAIAGDLVADLAAPQGTVPVTVVRDFRLPFTPLPRTLVVACSYSGNTRETLALFQQAIDAGATVVAITAGGVLARRAAETGTPVFTINAPGEPRSALGCNLMLLLGLLQRLALVSTANADVQSAVQALKPRVSSLGRNSPSENNPAKELALALYRKTPVVYGAGLFRGMARRWKTQFNENAKVWAFCETIPELLHNSVEAYADSPGLDQPLLALLLQPNVAKGGAGAHFRVVSQLLQRNGIPYRTIPGGDSSPLSQLLNMLALGDFASYYLALLRGVDPSPTPQLDLGKGLLGGP